MSAWRPTCHAQHVRRAAPGCDDHRNLWMPRLPCGPASQRHADGRGHASAARRSALHADGQGVDRLRLGWKRIMDHRRWRARLRHGVRRALSGHAACDAVRGETAFDFVMTVENLSAAPMDLMYLCHAN